MDREQSTPSVMRDPFFKTSLWSTVVTLLACLATHLLTLFGLIGAVAWMTDVEHALVVALVGLAVLTIYAFFRHRRGCRHR